MPIIYAYRRPIIVMLHLALIVLSNYLAFWLRFEGAVPDREELLFLQTIPLLLLVRGATFVPFGLYQGLWRYTGIWDLRNIIFAVVLSTCLFYAATHTLFGMTGYPRSVCVIDSLLLVFILGGIRLSRRIYKTLGRVERKKPIVIYGAGDAGEMIVRDMKNNSFYEYEPIGFIDDDLNKVGRRIHGVKVLGTRAALPEILANNNVRAVLVAMPRSEPVTIRKIVKLLEPYKVMIKTLPNLKDLLDGKVEISDIRNLAIADLLERIPAGLDSKPVEHLIRGRRVLVTGAAGSIGSELCRQIVACQPSLLVLFERYENGLYSIAKELDSTPGVCRIQAVIGDVTDRNRIHRILCEHRPSIVFHAAAHKHVPLMEASPCEAVKNNVLGTRVVAEAAAESGVERFILISSDKAVNPTSVMGATKRVAEFIVQNMRRPERGAFAAVRFGNVLGSNGSVVPLFLEQIKAGGPVTVTHPEMRRYFMLIPEAVQLVLQAAVSAYHGEVFVLEMGEQIKVLDLARNLIRLAGFIPEVEIPISFVGIRPGEKLHEELVEDDEIVEPSGIRQIIKVRPKRRPNPVLLNDQISELERAAFCGDADAVIERLCEIVPTYKPERSAETVRARAQVTAAEANGECGSG